MSTGIFRTLGGLVPASVRALIREQRQRVRVRRQYSRGGGDLSAVAAIVRLAIFPKRTILFYPSLPDEWQVVYKLCLLNGYRMVSDPLIPHDVVHKHEKETVSADYERMWDGKRVINARSNDISKMRVQRVFAEVFEYQLEVDPRSYRGRAVKKSDANYRHDGMIIECPCEPDDEEGVVYQRLVDTENSGGFCVDHRVPVLGGEVPVVYLKYKPLDDRFDTITHADIVKPHDAFSQEELGLISKFARAMGLDFGELDVLRDRDDGRIYVVDVNNTPSGPQRGFSSEQQRQAASVLASAYRRLVEAYAP
jgi:hypothetical protein